MMRRELSVVVWCMVVNVVWVVGGCGNVTIGVLYSSVGLYGPNGWVMPQLGKIWQSKVVEQGGINGCWYPNVMVSDVMSDSKRVANATKSLINAGAQVLVGPEGIMIEIAAQTALPYNIPVIGTASGSTSSFFCVPPLSAPCTKTDRSRRFKNLYSTLTPASDYFDPLLRDIMIRRDEAKLKTAAVLYSTLGANRDVCEGAINSLNQYKFQLTGIWNVSSSITDDLQQSAIKQSMREMVATSPDIVILCDLSHCPLMFQQLVALDYTPKMTATFECMNQYTNWLNQVQLMDMMYIISPVQWDPRITGYSYTDAGDPAQKCCAYWQGERPSFNMSLELERIAKKEGIQYPVPAMAGPGWAGFMWIEYAIARSNNSALLNQFQFAEFRTLNGWVMSDAFGRNTKRTIFYVQLQPTGLELVLPDNVATAKVVLTAPAFHERIYVQRLYQTESSETWTIIVASILSSVTVAVMGLLIWNRSMKIVMASSIRFSIATLFGYMILLWAMILSWPVDNNDYTCSARVPSIVLAYTLMFQPILAKNWRIAKIFESNTLRKVNLPDSHVLGLFMCASLPFYMIVIFWCSLDPLKPILIVPDPLRPSFNYHECGSQSSIGFIAILSYACLNLVGALYLCYRVRRAFAWIDETGPIEMSVFGQVVGFIIIWLFHSTYVQRTFGVFVATTIGLLPLYFHIVQHCLLVLFDLPFTTTIERTQVTKESPPPPILVISSQGSPPPPISVIHPHENPPTHGPDPNHVSDQPTDNPTPATP